MRSFDTTRKRLIILLCVVVLSVSFSFRIFAIPALSKSNVSIRVGDVAVLKVTGTKKTVNWKTSKRKVVQIVSSTNDRITARVGKKTLACKINVKKAIAFPNTRTIMVGDAFKLKLPRTGKWRLSKKGIVSINKTKGKIVKINSTSSGIVYVIANIGKTQKRCKVRVLKEYKKKETENSTEETAKQHTTPETENDNEQSIDNYYSETNNGEKNTLPANVKGYYAFGSGAGGWGSWIILEADGSFEAGSSSGTKPVSGTGFVGRVYEGACTGRFTNIQKKSETSYTMRMSDLQYEKKIGTEIIENNIQHVYSAVIGIEEGETFVLYLSGTPRQELPEDLQSGGFMMAFNDDKLAGGFIYNESTGARFNGPYPS